ncbi:hypothetical protein H0A66_02855 [Alcaligenaceae bacterium]|nr:hypothetical protein [Alcaligenaceae bacterium]
MFAVAEEVLSRKEVAEMDSVEPGVVVRELLQRIQEDSKKLLIDPSPEINSIVRAGAIFSAKIEYLRRRLIGAHGDVMQLTQEERGWISELDGALLRYTQLVINGLAKVFPYILGNKAEISARGDDVNEKLSIFHALPGLVLSANEIKELLLTNSYQVARLYGTFFHSVFAAQQMFRLSKLGKSAMGGKDDLTNLPQTKLIFDYVVGGTDLAAKICETLGVSLRGSPAITILDEDTPPVVCIEYLLDASPLVVCKANDGLAKAIAGNKLKMPADFHVCFGVA